MNATFQRPGWNPIPSITQQHAWKVLQRLNATPGGQSKFRKLQVACYLDELEAFDAIQLLLDRRFAVTTKRWARKPTESTVKITDSGTAVLDG